MVSDHNRSLSITSGGDANCEFMRMDVVFPVVVESFLKRSRRHTKSLGINPAQLTAALRPRSLQNSLSGVFDALHSSLRR